MFRAAMFAMMLVATPALADEKPPSVSGVVVPAPMKPVQTMGGFEAPFDLVAAANRLHIPDDARFALTQIVENDKGERTALRFDPRKPKRKRWEVLELPDTQENKSRDLKKALEKTKNPDRKLVLETPNPAAFVFDRKVRETEKENVYGFRVKDLDKKSDEVVPGMRGEFFVDKQTLNPVRVEVGFGLEGEGQAWAGFVKLSDFKMVFDLAEVEGCCIVAVHREQLAKGKSLGMESKADRKIWLKDVEYAPGVKLDYEPKL